MTVPHRFSRFSRYALFAVLLVTLSFYFGFPACFYPRVPQPHIDVFSNTLTPEWSHGQSQALLKYVPEVGPGREPRMNATFVTLARNRDLWEIARSIRQLEDRFNRNYHYDWVFLNDQPFSEEFKRTVSMLVSGNTKFGVIPTEHWSYPPWINQGKAAKTREEMKAMKILYGESESYRHMCRFESGFFFRHPLMEQYDYYWRVEPSVSFFCDLPYDPFRFMASNKKKYGFVISLYEYSKTVSTLWQSVRAFIREYPEHIHHNNALDFVSSDGGISYNLCHFWSNFEIGDLNFFRSKPYMDFFNFLDKEGGFFYERWGDAPVHSIAAALLLSKDETHFFDDIGYRHAPYTHCPNDKEKRLQLRCDCDPDSNFDWKGYSCLSRYFDTTGIQRPRGYETIAPLNGLPDVDPE